MTDITSISLKAFIKYFNTLSKLGYKSYSDVNKLLILTCIEEVLTGEMSFFVTEEDYRSIINVLYSIMGSGSLIELPNYNTWKDTINKSSNYGFRATENDTLRNLNGGNFRTEV